MNGNAWQRLAPPLLLLLCIALYLGVFIWPGLEDLGRSSLQTSFDFHSYFLPRFTLGSRDLLRGELPVWNPYEYGGIPLLATGQPAVFYFPKILIFGLLDPEPAVWVFMALHYVALGGTFLAFARSQGVSGPPALVGAVVWVFSWPLLASNYSPVRIANLVWMPLVFLYADRLARMPTRSTFAKLALVVGIQVTAGYPEFCIDEGLLLISVSLVAWLSGSWSRPPWVTLPLLGGAFVLGSMAAGAQLVPLAELGTVAQRTQMAVQGATGIPLGRALLMVVPGLVVFTFAGFFVRRAWLAAAGLATCWLTGEGGWLLLRKLPGFSMVRFPLAWVLIATFFCAWLAALGYQALEDGTFGPRARRLALGAVVASGLALIAAFALGGYRLLHGQRPDTHFGHYLSSPLAAGLGILGGALVVAAAVVSLRGRPSTPLWFAAITAATIAHSAAFPFGSVPSPLKRPFKVGHVAMIHGHPRDVRGRVLSLEDLLYGYEIYDRLPSPLGVEISFLPHRYRLLLDRLGYAPMFAQIDWKTVLSARGFLDALDVQYVTSLASRADTFGRAGLVPARRLGEFGLYENRRRMGHAWVNYAVRTARSEGEALEAVLSHSFDPHREVLLEQALREAYASEGTPPSATAPDRETRSSATRVDYEVTLERPGVLVSSESAYPGWTATVDGEPREILRADFVLRAVEVPAGHHTVRFEYRPASIRWGIVVSAVGASAIAGLLASGFRRRAPASRAAS